MHRLRLLTANPKFWLKLLAGSFFVYAGIDRAMYGGRIPSLWPTFMYLATGLRLLFDEFFR